MTAQAYPVPSTVLANVTLSIADTDVGRSTFAGQTPGARVNRRLVLEVQYDVLT